MTENCSSIEKRSFYTKEIFSPATTECLLKFHVVVVGEVGVLLAKNRRTPFPHARPDAECATFAELGGRYVFKQELER
jgi:hypothetical protein